ncbi:MAG: hypothetical protein MSG64_10295 [Pyrinomonadaceae bacterium MAG19_C2-C3]|nr:hypothetical protein [Pyrinomonadaceae bacterium MAG19_C2-C3]
MSFPQRLTNNLYQTSTGTRTGRSTRARIGFTFFCLFLTLTALSVGAKMWHAEAARTTKPKPVNGVQVTPSEVTLPARGGVQFTAEVMGIEDQRVGWSVNSDEGGNAAVGTISAGGLYTAPDLSPDEPPIQFLVRATSLANPSMFGEATVTVTGRGSQFRSPSVSVQHGDAPATDTISSFNSTGVSVMFGEPPSSNTIPSFLSNAVSVRYGTPSSDPFSTYFSNAVSVQYGTPPTNPLSAYFSNAVSVYYGAPPAQTTTVEPLSYTAEGYRYLIISPSTTPPPGFEQPDFDDSAWRIGRAGFGGGNCAGLPVNTSWGTNSRLLVRRVVSIPSDAMNVRVFVSIDNDVEAVFFNGTQISLGRNTNGCANRDDFVYRVPQTLIQSSGNVVAYHLYDYGVQSFFDTRIVADISCTDNCPQGSLASLTLNPSTVNGGQPSTGTVTLVNPAPLGGATVNLSSGDTNIATVPASVTIPQGATSGTFTVSTPLRQTDTAVNISASYAGETKVASLIVLAPQVLSSLALNPSTVTGGQTSTGTVTLFNPAPSGGLTVNLSSSDTAVATVPSTLAIPQGATSGTFTVQTSVATSNRNVQITASISTESRVATLTVNRLVPDLQVTLDAPPPQAATDAAFDVSWTITNNGQATATAPWVDKVFLSVDSQPGNDALIGEFPFSNSLEPNGSAVRIQTVSIPRSAVSQSGSYRLIVVTDANNNVNEGANENNNFSVRQIQVTRTPRPDLIVEPGSVIAPDTAFFDQTIRVQWQVRNVGDSSTDAGEWRDRIYLSLNQTIDAEDTLLGNISNVSYLSPGESYVAGADVRLPRGVFGNYNIIILADADRSVAEDNESNNAESNNTGAKPLNIQIPPLPDLQTTLVQSSEEVFAGNMLPLIWRVENRGTGNTASDQNAWVDSIYLSQDQTFSSTADRLIGTRTREGGLVQNDGYTVSNFSVAVPNNIAGEWYVFIVADGQDRIYEFTNENNNANYDREQPGSPLRIIPTPPPDLIIPLPINAPDNGTAARQITVNWTVRNQGAFEAKPRWFDTVYLSDDETLNPTADTPLATVLHNGTLDAGLEYNASATVTIPACISGMYYLFVATDSRSQIFEFDPSEDAEANNSSLARAIQITSAPSDLRVTEVNNAGTGNAGQSVQVGWTVTNAGIGATIENSWVDQVYFSTSEIFNPGNALLVGTFTQNGGLAQGATYTRTETMASGCRVLKRRPRNLHAHGNNRRAEHRAGGVLRLRRDRRD